MSGRNLVVLCDGTWNREDNPALTNIATLNGELSYLGLAEAFHQTKNKEELLSLKQINQVLSQWQKKTKRASSEILSELITYLKVKAARLPSYVMEDKTHHLFNAAHLTKLKKKLHHTAPRLRYHAPLSMEKLVDDILYFHRSIKQAAMNYEKSVPSFYHFYLKVHEAIKKAAHQIGWLVHRIRNKFRRDYVEYNEQEFLETLFKTQQEPVDHYDSPLIRALNTLFHLTKLKDYATRCEKLEPFKTLVKSVSVNDPKLKACHQVLEEASKSPNPLDYLLKILEKPERDEQRDLYFKLLSAVSVPDPLYFLIERMVDSEAGLEVSQDKSPLEQVIYYDRGVGTWGAISSILAGITGEGLDLNVRQAYAFLCKNHQEGDHIYLSGFSRGAYTVRCLVSMISKIGLLQAEDATDEKIRVAFEFYKRVSKLDHEKKPILSSQEIECFRRENGVRRVKPEFLGVYDTVGAIGLPDIGPIQADEINRDLFGFYDTDVRGVQKVRHALALDEHRDDFVPTLMPENPSIQQRWFVGAHSDVGGGILEKMENRNYPI